MSTAAPRQSLLERLRPRRRRPARLPVIQIEVTSRCFLNCTFCPNKVLGHAWQHGDMDWEMWQRWIAPELHYFDLVYLQGWGEPLLQPHIFGMIADVKAAGCRAGFTTCGGLLDADRRQRLLESGLDILGVSFAGATAATHERLRHGSHFAGLADNVAALAEERRRAGSQLWLEMHFLMMRDNLAELSRFVALAAELGADEAVATNLSYAPTPEIASRAVLARQPDAAALDAVAAAQREAAACDIKFRSYPLAVSEEVLECDAHPSETAYVNFRGAVAPCVYLGIPVAGSAPRYFEGASHPLQPLCFGRLEDGLLDVMRGPVRSAFCAPFKARKRYGYSALASLAALSSEDTPELPPAPEPCRACYKLYGV